MIKKSIIYATIFYAISVNYLTAGTLDNQYISYTPIPSQQAESDPFLRSGNKYVQLKLKGWVNRAMMHVDTGVKSRLLHVDNDSSSTRIYLLGKAQMNDEWAIGTNFVFEMQSNESLTTDIIDSDSSVNFQRRQLEVYVHSKKFGKVLLGHGQTASDGSSEIDLLKTGAVSRNGSLQLMAGGIKFRRGGKVVGPAIRSVYSGMDGLSRKDRIRYDSPKFMGFQVRAGHIMQDSRDVGLYFSGKFGEVKTQAGVAYAKVPSKYEQVSGSGSVMLPNGTSVGFGAARQSLVAPFRKNPFVVFGKVGQQLDLFDFGTTKACLDFGRARHLNRNKDTAKIAGFTLLQEITRAATEVYSSMRIHTLDRLGEPDYRNIFAMNFGAKVRF
jgi:porin-like protein